MWRIEIQNFVCNMRMSVVNVWGKHFKLPQLTHESFLTIDHYVVLYVAYSTTHQRLVEVQFSRYQKIFCRSDLWSKSSHVLVMAA